MLRLATLILVLAGLAWLISEFRWARVNKPNGKFADVEGYLARSREPGRVCHLVRDGETYFIAYRPLDKWLAIPSGPAAYVFDRNGRMVDWSADTGDDRAFGKRWPEQSCLSSTTEELKKLASKDRHEKGVRK